jgi:hypothetical protein
VALVRKRTIPTERPPLVGEVSANLGLDYEKSNDGVINKLLRVQTEGFVEINKGYVDYFKTLSLARL